jgi:hypothetical protein
MYYKQVWDEQGKTDTSRVSFTVVEDPALKSAVDLVLDREMTRFTHTELRVSVSFINISVVVAL